MVDRLREESSLPVSGSDNPTERTFTIKHGIQATMKTDKIGKRGEPEPEYKVLDAEKPALASEESDEDTPPPEVLDYSAEQAQADVQEKFAEEHELRMAELAHLMAGEDKLAIALKELENMSNELAKAQEMIAFYKLRMGGMTRELNVLKSELTRYKKAFAAKDRAAKQTSTSFNNQRLSGRFSR